MKARLTLVFEKDLACNLTPSEQLNHHLFDAIEEGDTQMLFEEFDGLESPTESKIEFIE